MPKINEMIPKRYLTKDDVGTGVLATIAGVEKQNVAPDGADPEEKWVLHCNELNKPMVLNSTNIRALAAICGSEDTDGWAGKKIVLVNDPNVSFAGKMTGGIRVRAPRNQPAATPATDLGF
jgi:hypothetical protein